MKRRKPMKRRNEARRRRAFLEAYGGDYADLIRALPCIIAECNAWSWTIQASHVKSRGAGGKAKDLVPMCPDHHSEMHTLGIRTFESNYSIDLATEAARLWQANTTSHF